MANKNFREMSSTNNEEKNLLLLKDLLETERIKFINILLQCQKHVYIDKLDDIVTKYNNTYHRTIKKKPVDVNSSRYIYFNKENSKEAPKFKIGCNVRISKYKNIFAKGYFPN